MKKFLIFFGGFVAGILATFFIIYVYSVANKPNDGLLGLTIFEEKGDCLISTSKSKSTEMEVLQVIEPTVALAFVKYYTDVETYSGGTYRNYDLGNNVAVLLINYDNLTYYDEQTIDVSKKCLRQIGTYQYESKSEIQKTVPVVVIE
jgi:hypothetical protein